MDFKKLAVQVEAAKKCQSQSEAVTNQDLFNRVRVYMEIYIKDHREMSKIKDIRELWFSKDKK
jgi:hypothetical protein